MLDSRFHVGMIPDGNRRWAKERGLNPWEGHRIGGEKGELFIEWCIDHKDICEITVYGLSEENFKRPPKELNKLYENELISRQEYKSKKSEILSDL